MTNLSARIRVHRFNAFSDIPIFAQSYYDLAAPGRENLPDYSKQGPNPDSYQMQVSQFTCQESTAICVDSVLAITRYLDKLPFPRLPTTTTFLKTSNKNSAGQKWMSPRLMPSVSCCVMQASYILLMYCHKLKVIPEPQTSHLSLERLQAESHHGLGILISTMENYSISFGALRAMKGTFPTIEVFEDLLRKCLPDDIQGATEVAFQFE